MLLAVSLFPSLPFWSMMACSGDVDGTPDVLTTCLVCFIHVLYPWQPPSLMSVGSGWGLRRRVWQRDMMRWCWRRGPRWRHSGDRWVSSSSLARLWWLVHDDGLSPVKSSHKNPTSHDETSPSLCPLYIAMYFASRCRLTIVDERGLIGGVWSYEGGGRLRSDHVADRWGSFASFSDLWWLGGSSWTPAVKSVCKRCDFSRWAWSPSLRPLSMVMCFACRICRKISKAYDDVIMKKKNKV